METNNKINKALQIMENHDWYWCMADYTTPSKCEAYSSMRSFVEVVASIADKAIVKALRGLWVATYTYMHATMWDEDYMAKLDYYTMKAKLMAVIKPQQAMTA